MREDYRNPFWPKSPPPSILDDELIIRDADRPVRNFKRSDLPQRRPPSGFPSDGFIAGFCLGVVVALPLWALALAVIDWAASK